MAVKGSRRLRRGRRQTKRQRCAKHFRGRGIAARQAGGQAAAGTELPPAFSVRWGSKEAAAEGSPPPLLERQPCLQAAGPLTPPPSVTIPAGGPYALIAWDPDASQASWLHWLVVNIPGGSGLTGHTVTPWAPPTPPPGTGIHRYIFGLFLQDQLLDPKTVASQQQALTRAHFNPATFAEQHGLRPVNNKRIAVSAGPLP